MGSRGREGCFSGIGEPGRLAALRRDTMAAEARLLAAQGDFVDNDLQRGNGGASEFAMAKTASADHR